LHDGKLAALVGLLAATRDNWVTSRRDSPLSFAFAAAAFVATRRFKPDIGWIFGGALALRAPLLALGWAG